MVKQKITLTVDEEIVRQIDVEREDVTRSTFIQRILERRFKAQANKAKQTNKS